MEYTLSKKVEAESELLGAIPNSSWMLHVDWSSNTYGTRARLILASPNSDIIEQVHYFNFKTFNNKMEYEVLLMGLRLTWELRVQHLKALVTLS